MPWSEAADIASVVEAAVVAISLIFVAFQVWQQTRLARAANTHNIFHVSSDVNLQLLQDPDLARLWIATSRQTAGEPVTDDDVEEFRRQQMLVVWLLLHENIYHQMKAGLVERGVYAAWQADLRKYVTAPGVRERLPRMMDMLSADFATHLKTAGGEADGSSSGPASRIAPMLPTPDPQTPPKNA